MPLFNYLRLKNVRSLARDYLDSLRLSEIPSESCNFIPIEGLIIVIVYLLDCIQNCKIDSYGCSLARANKTIPLHHR